ncbi:thymine dioxygenase [Vararia minispora EC-137]|uniref:Thymine dioxygenase n=1 Tax=Vararia minispora EC-137 TaxID=1314806 RepID=A0ACB8QYV9_9AGAM|nr:thymine dioxygenase [Vararia minispora EC-137]
MSSESLGSGTGLVPIIDFEPFLTGSNKQAVADEILKSLKAVGFVQLINHGVPQEKVDEMFRWSKSFFSLPLETKQLAPHPPSGTHHRGYSAPGREKVLQHVYDKEKVEAMRLNVPDVKESFEVGREDDKIMPNIWLPDGVLPGFKQACLDFYWTCDITKFRILGALALGLGLDENYFESSHKVGDNQLRLLHYPSLPEQSLKNGEAARIGQHSDFGSITMLFQDAVGGLEVEDPNNPGEFKAVPSVENALVVNAGDFLMRWSNDLIRSTIHRVQAPPGSSKDGATPERYSIPYDFDTVVECLPGTYSDVRPKRYEPISASEYILQRLAATY